MTADDQLQQLVGAASAAETLYRFAAAIDGRDWKLLETVFAQELELDYSSHRAGNVGTFARADWVARARLRFETMKATQHTMSNPRVEIDGDGETALIKMYVEAWHLADIQGVEAWCTIGGEYTNRLQRADDGWEITALRLNRRWAVGDPAVLDLPVTAVAE